MCGILGMILADRQRSKDELEELRHEFTELLVATQVRGEDAAGVFVQNPDGIHTYKAAGPATKLTGENKYWDTMDKITVDTTAVIGHTRLATTGCPTCNANNHPITHRQIVGVHNGVIDNADDIRGAYPFKAEVDSAAIFALLSGVAVTPLTRNMLAETLPRLTGDLAIIAADKRLPGHIFVARDNSRPIVFGRDTDRGVLWLASTTAIMIEGLMPDFRIKRMPANTIAELTPAHADGKRIKYTGWIPTPRIDLLELYLASLDITGKKFKGGKLPNWLVY